MLVNGADVDVKVFVLKLFFHQIVPDEPRRMVVGRLLEKIKLLSSDQGWKRNREHTARTTPAILLLISFWSKNVPGHNYY